MEIVFPGGLKVDVLHKGFTVKTDQPGLGGGSAPTPFDLFIASIGSCAGIYVLSFCRKRGLPTEGLAMKIDVERGGDGGLSRVVIAIRLPKDFPERYRSAVVKAAEACAVKQSIQNPPAFEVGIAD